MAWPKRIEPDPIAEAIIELRFDTPMSTATPEIVVGRLLDNPEWRATPPQRLAIADIPATIRRQEDGMRHQPTFQVSDPARQRIIKIGEQVLSYHRLPPYPGWTQFEAELKNTIAFLFAAVSNISVKRIGMRYVNLLSKEAHGINGVQDLNYSVYVREQVLTDPQIVTYQRAHGEEHLTLVRVSSPDFVATPHARTFSGYIDVDVFTPPGYSADSPDMAMKWVGYAHQVEKDEFFGLLKPETIERLGKV